MNEDLEGFDRSIAECERSLAKASENSHYKRLLEEEKVQLNNYRRIRQAMWETRLKEIEESREFFCCCFCLFFFLFLFFSHDQTTFRLCNYK